MLRSARPAPPRPLRPSPFVAHNNYGGGFVSDEDRVMLQSLIYASPASAGVVAREWKRCCHCRCRGLCCQPYMSCSTKRALP